MDDSAAMDIRMAAQYLSRTFNDKSSLSIAAMVVDFSIFYASRVPY
jgi:hypothetical protein